MLQCLAEMRFTMRTIGLFLIGLMLGSCTNRIFPAQVMQGTETDSFDIQGWEDQAYRPSNTAFVPHKVELAGMILQVNHKPNGIVILAKSSLLMQIRGRARRRRNGRMRPGSQSRFRDLWSRRATARIKRALKVREQRQEGRPSMEPPSSRGDCHETFH